MGNGLIHEDTNEGYTNVHISNGDTAISSDNTSFKKLNESNKINNNRGSRKHINPVNPDSIHHILASKVQEVDPIEIEQLMNSFETPSDKQTGVEGVNIEENVLLQEARSGKINKTKEDIENEVIDLLNKAQEKLAEQWKQIDQESSPTTIEATPAASNE